MDHKILHGEVRIRILDYWVGVIGDSFASGEGNPDVPVNALEKTMAKWLSSSCISCTHVVLYTLIFNIIGKKFSA